MAALPCLSLPSPLGLSPPPLVSMPSSSSSAAAAALSCTPSTVAFPCKRFKLPQWQRQQSSNPCLPRQQRKHRTSAAAASSDTPAVEGGIAAKVEQERRAASTAAATRAGTGAGGVASTGHETSSSSLPAVAAAATLALEPNPLLPADASAIAEEVVACHQLVQRMGRGFVYLGSSRIEEGHSFFEHSLELSRDVAARFGRTTWSGIGPGLMDAACRGAMAAGRPAAGMKVLMEAQQKEVSYSHPYLPSHSYITCRSISARKQGLVFAGSRHLKEEAAGFVALPGGLGTLDEVLSILAMMQLKMLGSPLPVPLVVMNYDGCYDGLLQLFHSLKSINAVRDGEVEGLCLVARDNTEAMHILERFFS